MGGPPLGGPLAVRLRKSATAAARDGDRARAGFRGALGGGADGHGGEADAAELAEADDVAVRDEGGAEQDRLELGVVAGPAVVLQERERQVVEAEGAAVE